MKQKGSESRVPLLFLMLTFAILTLDTRPLFSQSTEERKQEELRDFVALTNMQSASDKFANLGFGIAVGLSTFFKTFDLEAEAENGIVRVKKDGWVFGDIILETHKFWTFNKPTSPRDFPSLGIPGITFEANTLGVGPFFGILMNSEDIISAVTFGGMVGFRPDTTSPNSLNFGIGPIFKLNLRMLRKDLVPGERLPDGLTEIKYQEKSLLGLAVVFSFTWANL